MCSKPELSLEDVICSKLKWLADGVMYLKLELSTKGAMCSKLLELTVVGKMRSKLKLSAEGPIA